MRFKFKFKDVEEWHRWFAWRPVFVEDEIVWLEFIERRINFSFVDPIGVWTEYRYGTQA